MYKHIVCFKFKEKSEAPVVAEKLRSLKDSVPQIRQIELGLNEHDTLRSYDLVLITTFDSEEDYQIYDKAQPHQEVRKYIHAVREASVAVDYHC